VCACINPKLGENNIDHVHVKLEGKYAHWSASTPTHFFPYRSRKMKDSDEDSFPWQFLKAECLRLVCQQLFLQTQQSGLANVLGKRDDMIAFLRDVSTRGCEFLRLFLL